MANAYLAIALHFHQPVGNFEHIFERAYKNCYYPLIDSIFQHPAIKISFHLSGPILDYLQERHPQILKKIRAMVSKGQIEIISGAFYEPILIAIPRRDAIGQMKMQSAYVSKNLGYKPKGAWVPERVWQQKLAGYIHDAKLHYCVLDDIHLKMAGISEDEKFGYYTTGFGSAKIAVFPSNKNLRYLIPFKPANETIDYCRNILLSKKNVLFVYGDDAEKFGEWPGTRKWVFEDKWLESFLTELEKNASWLKTITFSEYLTSHKPIGSVSIPEASYDEMIEWTGGSWMNFLSNYPETNQMHKKMLYISEKIEKIEKSLTKNNFKKLEEAKQELYKGQCNCGYWHGVFGGLYLYHLRKAIYGHLITADKIADEIIHKKKQDWQEIRQLDFNSDGKDEIIIENQDFSIYVDPNEGACIKELDYRELSLNIINTLSRKKESYHQKIVDSIKETTEARVATIHDDFRTVDSSLKKKLIYDKFPRYCLRSYFLKKDLTIDDFTSFAYEELGDFASGVYSIKQKDNSVIFQHQSKVLNTTLQLSKEIMIKSGKDVESCFIVRNKGSKNIDAFLGVEFNITMPNLNSDKYNYICGNKNIAGLNTKGSVVHPVSFGIYDSLKEFSVNLVFSAKPQTLFYFPVETVSQSERAYELNYQCSCIMLLWKLDFDDKDKFSFNMNLIFKTYSPS